MHRIGLLNCERWVLEGAGGGAPFLGGHIAELGAVVAILRFLPHPTK
jgi:hypothetical protein